MIALWIVVALILLIGGFVLYRFVAFRKEGKAHNALQVQRILPLLKKIESGVELRIEDVLPFARDNRTRCTTYELLQAHDKLGLFPKEFDSVEAAAEGRLVNWLEFPTELGIAPDAVEHVDEVVFELDDQDMHYRVFKFRMNEPDRRAKAGWELGVVGPYLPHSLPYDQVGGTFSRGNGPRKFDEIDPKDEARWVHENIVLKRGSRP